jgi:hypothetical protein
MFDKTFSFGQGSQQKTPSQIPLSIALKALLEFVFRIPHGLFRFVLLRQSFFLFRNRCKPWSNLRYAKPVVVHFAIIRLLAEKGFYVEALLTKFMILSQH